MKEPNLKNLKINKRETKIIRDMVKARKRIKITVNLDEEVLKYLKTESDSSGIPYQTLMNQILVEAIDKREISENRIERLERDIETLKKKVG